MLQRECGDDVWQTQKKPNILVIWGDDIGHVEPQLLQHGMMGYRTPNIDRIANEGMRSPTTTASRAAPRGARRSSPARACFRTGLTKVGMPGRRVGLQAEDPTIAELLKPLGYATGQFGKNHLGDRNEYLPTVHGFDEFFGNLYHLNAEEEPGDSRLPDREGLPEFKERFGPRGVLHCWATDKDDTTERAALGQGRQAEDRGHRPADQEAHGDAATTSSSAPPWTSSSASTRPDKPFFVLAQHHAHALPDAHRSRRASARPGAGSRRTTTR